MNIYRNGELWGDGAGAAEALSDTYEEGHWFYTGVDSQVLLSVVLSGGPEPTSLELQVEWRENQTLQVQTLDLRSVVTPATGIVDVDPKTFQISPAPLGAHSVTLHLPRYTVLRLKAKRTGGASDPDLLITGQARPVLPFDFAAGGGGGGGGGGGTLLEATATAQAEGDRDLAIGADAFLLKAIQVTIASRDWSLAIQRKDDHSTGELELLRHRSGDVHLALDLPWTDQDASEELHYTLTDHAGTATHTIAVAALELETP